MIRAAGKKETSKQQLIARTEYAARAAGINVRKINVPGLKWYKDWCFRDMESGQKIKVHYKWVIAFVLMAQNCSGVFLCSPEAWKRRRRRKSWNPWQIIVRNSDGTFSKYRASKACNLRVLCYSKNGDRGIFKLENCELLARDLLARKLTARTRGTYFFANPS